MPLIRLENYQGINNRASDSKMPEGFLRACNNFNLDVNGLLNQRDGYVLVLAGVFTCIWSDNIRCFAVMDNNLIEITKSNGVYSAALIQASVDSSLAFSECDGDYYFVGATVSGKVGIGTFGIDKVLTAPTSAAISGTMEAGQYQIAVTHVDAQGFESGVGEYTVIDLPASSSIRLTSIPVSTNPRVLYSIIYVSPPNGKEMYRNGVVANGVTTLDITSFSSAAMPLLTQLFDAAPFGSILRYHYGRLFIAADNQVFYSHGQDYEHFDLRDSLNYPANVTAVCPVEDGLWISADALYFVQGRNPDVFSVQESQIRKADLHIVHGSDVFIEARNLGVGNYSGSGWIVTTEDGVLALGNSGFMLNMTNVKYLMPDYTTIAATTISGDDSFQYVAVLQ